jgi:hypothetical protein
MPDAAQPRYYVYISVSLYLREGGEYQHGGSYRRFVL